ncbi:MAG: hypothetical protein M1817_004264 [Caeruleum heppii]|nr:MAG: hypothetical protein M1817_004264 [Caeruleum heppii]
MAEAENISITICGDGGCGKSSITLRLVKSEWSYDYDPTIEDSYSVTRTVDGRTYNLSLTDTAGQEEYRSLWAASNLRSDAFLLVYDITNAESLANLDFYLQMIAMETDQRQDEGRPLPVKIVAGNKCDLGGMRQVKSATGLEYARRHGCGFMETSARNMVNIEETFALLVRRAVEQRRLIASTTSGRHPQLSTTHSHHSNTRPQSSLRASKSTHQHQPSGLSEKHNQRLNSVDFGERPGGKVKRGGFWARLKCW